jgi:hypothetical protein
VLQVQQGSLYPALHSKQSLLSRDRACERDLLSELRHCFARSTRRFSSLNQFSAMLICVGADSELIELVRWIASDGQLRTDDQIIDEIIPTLGFSRRGVRIESAIRNAIALWRPPSYKQ